MLFCLASGDDWERAGVTHGTAQYLLRRGLNARASTPLDDAIKFNNSEVWKKTAAERAKTGKTIRRYAVEAEP
jgi:hypothetical protein